jgi:hypothetical protein
VEDSRPRKLLEDSDRRVHSSSAQRPLSRRLPVAVCLFCEPALLCKGKQSFPISRAAGSLPGGFIRGDNGMRTDWAARPGNGVAAPSPRCRGGLPAWRRASAQGESVGSPKS